MKIRTQPRRDGIALVIVLIVIMVLGILAGRFATSMKVETTLARNAALDADLEWLGRSGVELARYVIAEESAGPMGMVDSLMKKWAGGPGDTNSPVAGIPLDRYELGAGWIAVKIIDNDRKFNINVAALDESMQRQRGQAGVLGQAMFLIGVEQEARSAIIESIVDWCDTDKLITGSSGAETAYYETLQPAYRAKNGPFDDLSELLLVKGVTPAVYWGSGAAGHMQVLNRPQMLRGSQFQEPSYAIGLVDLFTPLSGRTININTVSATVLQLIPEIDENMVNLIISSPEWRAGPDGADGTEDDMPFRSPQEIMGRLPMLGGPPGSGGPAGPGGPGAPGGMGVTRYFGVRSIVFEVQVDAHIGNYHRKYVAVLRRTNNPRDLQVLSFCWKSS